MIPITSKFVLVRIDSHTKEETVIFQSDNRKEIQEMKGYIESQIELNDFMLFRYSIKESAVDVSKN